MPNTILNYDPSVDLTKHIFWQYNNAPAINSLINTKQNWFNKNQTEFWNDWVKNVLNITTANDYGLSIWGALLQVPRVYNVEGDDITLTTNQYRTVLLARLKLLHTRATVPEINKLLKFLFGQYGKAYVVDNFDMTITYRFNFNLSALQLAVLQNVTLLPRPAGVQAVIVASDNVVFGFNGSSAQPFDNAPFATYIHNV
ncbi:DUF2612 domain-containing protein [bacterium]|nr:DUF2612 domain-containing protein [bacterium]